MHIQTKAVIYALDPTTRVYLIRTLPQAVANALDQYFPARVFDVEYDVDETSVYGTNGKQCSMKDDFQSQKVSVNTSYTETVAPVHAKVMLVSLNEEPIIAVIGSLNLRPPSNRSHASVEQSVFILNTEILIEMQAHLDSVRKNMYGLNVKHLSFEYNLDDKKERKVEDVPKLPQPLSSLLTSEDDESYLKLLQSAAKAEVLANSMSHVDISD
jgi:hypothetical protein